MDINRPQEKAQIENETFKMRHWFSLKHRNITLELLKNCFLWYCNAPVCFFISNWTDGAIFVKPDRASAVLASFLSFPIFPYH